MTRWCAKLGAVHATGIQRRALGGPWVFGKHAMSLLYVWSCSFALRVPRTEPYLTRVWRSNGKESIYFCAPRTTATLRRLGGPWGVSTDTFKWSSPNLDMNWAGALFQGLSRLAALAVRSKGI